MGFLNPATQPKYTLEVPGPWRVGSVGVDWVIFHHKTGRYKRVGRVMASRTNYFDEACRLACERNSNAMHSDKDPLA